VKLYTYFRSSASFRARIGLHWKGIAFEPVFVHLRRGEQLGPEYLAENPEGRVPLLVDGDVRLSQALAILEYLEETHPEPALLPASPEERARVRQLALCIVADTQPLQNAGPMSYLADVFELDRTATARWYVHWVLRGLRAVEAHLDHPAAGEFCHGDRPTLADVCVVPQVVSARRAGLDLSSCPRLSRIADACLELEAFRLAAPEAQPDFEA